MSEDVPKVGTVPQDRRRINRIVTQRINELTGYRLTDAFCGFKAYRWRRWRACASASRAMRFRAVWIQAARAGLTVIERPVPLICAVF